MEKWESALDKWIAVRGESGYPALDWPDDDDLQLPACDKCGRPADPETSARVHGEVICRRCYENMIEERGRENDA